MINFPSLFPKQKLTGKRDCAQISVGQRHSVSRHVIAAADTFNRRPFPSLPLYGQPNPADSAHVPKQWVAPAADDEEEQEGAGPKLYARAR